MIAVAALGVQVLVILLAPIGLGAITFATIRRRNPVAPVEYHEGSKHVIAAVAYLGIPLGPFTPWIVLEYLENLERRDAFATSHAEAARPVLWAITAFWIPLNFLNAASLISPWWTLGALPFVLGGSAYLAWGAYRRQPVRSFLANGQVRSGRRQRGPG